MRRWRSWLLLALILAAWAWLEWRDAAGRSDRGPMATSERVAERFTLCGRGRAHGCVIDGDSIHLGPRRIRIQGIDAPEIHGRCPAETALAAQSRDRLLALLNAGPFTMGARTAGARDQYGRELRVLERVGADGKRQSIGEAMIAAGMAHRYEGHKLSWC